MTCGRVFPLFAIAILVISVGPAAGSWSPEFQATGFSSYGKLDAVAEFEGDLVVAGSFGTAGEDSVSNIARWDGSHWRPLGQGLPSVRCLAVHGGRLFAGGGFSVQKSSPATGLAVWDGDSWHAVTDSLEGEVLAMTSYQGELVIGGIFTLEGETAISHLARWDGTVWRALGEGVDGGGRTRVEALTIHEGELVVGGVFGRAGQVETFHIARWNGREWNGMGAGADDAVTALASSGEVLYAGGAFRTIDGDSASCVAAWDGGEWGSLGAGISSSLWGPPTIEDLVVWRGELIVAGKFDRAGGLPVGSIATWDGQEWWSEPPGFFDHKPSLIPGEVLDLGIHGGRLVAAGRMLGGEGFLVKGLGLWDGAAWDPLVAGQGIAGSVYEEKWLGGRLFLQCGGPAGPANIEGLVVWEGGAWRLISPDGPDVATPFVVDAGMITEHQGRIVAFGKLLDPEHANGCRPRSGSWHLAEWDGAWRMISPPVTSEIGWMRALHSVGNDLVVLAGWTEPGGGKWQGASWDGDRWRPLLPQEPGVQLLCSAVLEDRLVIALTRSLGEAHSSFTIAAMEGGDLRVLKQGTDSHVWALGVCSGRLVASIGLGKPGTSETNHLQEWDGSTWRPLPGTFTKHHSSDGLVRSIVEFQGRLVVAGSFRGVDRTACDSVAFWDGTAWRPLAGGVDGDVTCLAAADSSLWLGGEFPSAGGIPSRNVARWDGPLPGSGSVGSLLPFEPEARPEPTGVGADVDVSSGPPASSLPFANGNFQAWTDGLPFGWTWSVRPSDLGLAESAPPQWVPGGGVAIGIPAVDNGMGMLSQRFAVEGNRYYKFRATFMVIPDSSGSGAPEFSMRVEDERRISPERYSTSLHNGFVVELATTNWDTAEIILRTDPRADVCRVTFTALSPGGRLLLRDVTVDTVTLSDDDVIRMMIAGLRSRYVEQREGQPDWDNLEHEARDSARATGRKLEESIKSILAALQEQRVTLETGSGDHTVLGIFTDDAWTSAYFNRLKERRDAIRLQLMDWNATGGMGISGWTKDGILYLDLRDLHVREGRLGDLEQARGILLDLRSLGFHHSSRYSREVPGAKLAAILAGGPAVYGMVRRKSGEEDLLSFAPDGEAGPGLLAGKPVVCLVGPGCIGNGAEFALMMRAIPGITFVGTPTRGGSGGGGRILLPLGSIVNYPDRWLFSPQGELINDNRGLVPDIIIESGPSLDPVFEEGLRVLREKIASEGG